MNYYGKISILITGVDGLSQTAEYIQQHFKNSKQAVPILNWSKDINLPNEKPYILILNESDLAHDQIKKINPDVIVIKNFGNHSDAIQKNYLNLYLKIGPHVNTVLNADDQASVNFAALEPVKKGRIFYYSKNAALENQIEKIGGVVGRGDELKIFGFNFKSEIINFKISKVLTFNTEVALLSSLAALMTVGLDADQLKLD